MSALKYLFDKPMSTVLSEMSVLIYFVSKMSASKYLFDKPLSIVLSEMSVLIMCVCMCLYMCVHMWKSSGITCIAQNNYKQR